MSVNRTMSTVEGKGRSRRRPSVNPPRAASCLQRATRRQATEPTVSHMTGSDVMGRGVTGSDITEVTSQAVKSQMSVSRIGKLGQKGSVLFLCDMQEKFRNNVAHFQQVVSVAARMLQAATVLEMPVIVTEQYPKGLGPTVPELGADNLKKYSKTCFSMLTPEVEEALRAIPELRSIILCGIETQACIMSTTLDLLERGLDVHVVADACSSRSQVDRFLALSRVKQSGAFLTTSEGVILQLVQDAAHPRFKEIQKIIKDPAADSGLLSLFPGQNPLFN